MNSLRLPNDQPILYQLSHVLTRVSVGNFRRFVRVEPNFSLPTLEDSSCQPLLQPQSAAGSCGWSRVRRVRINWDKRDWSTKQGMVYGYNASLVDAIGLKVQISQKSELRTHL